MITQDGLLPSVASVRSAQAAASTPTIWLDTYYDSAIFASKSAAIQAAYAAAVASASVLECQASRVYSLDTAALQLNPSAPFVLEGRKATFQSNWGKPRCIDFARTADFQTFNDIEIRDLIVDSNNLTDAANQSAVGNMINGNAGQRVNFARVAFRRVMVKNLPTGTGRYLGFALGCAHLASNEGTQNTITDVVFEDCQVTGGDYGYWVVGTGTFTAGLGVNVFLDRIELTRCYWNRGVTPAASASGAGIQLASVGFGGICTVKDCHLYNSTDIGVEIDAFQSAVCENTETVDCFNGGFLYRNFRAPLNLYSQLNIWRGCAHRNINLDPSSATPSSIGYAINGDTSTAGYIFGEALLDGCEVDCRTAYASPEGNGYAFDSHTVQFRKLTIRNFAIGFSNLAITATGINTALFRIQSALSGAVYDLDGITIRMAGARSVVTGPTINWKVISLDGTSFTHSVKRVTVDIGSFANIAAGTTSDTFFWIALGGIAASTGRGHVDEVRFVTAPSGGSHNAAWVNNFTANGSLDFTRFDTSLLPASGSDFLFASTALATASRVSDWISLRTTPAPANITGLVTATGKASGQPYKGNWVFTQGSGAGITAIDYSTNGGTTYTNALTQAAGAMPAGADLTIPALPPDALVKVTFATTQPTITFVPVAI